MNHADGNTDLNQPLYSRADCQTHREATKPPLTSPWEQPGCLAQEVVAGAEVPLLLHLRHWPLCGCRYVKAQSGPIQPVEAETEGAL